MSRRKIEEQQPEERDKLTDSNCPEVPGPRSKFIPVPGRHGSDDNRDVHGEIRYDNTDMPPFVGQEFWQGKSSHLS